MSSVSKRPCEVSCSPCAVATRAMPTTWLKMLWSRPICRCQVIRIKGNSARGFSRLPTTPSLTTRRVAGRWKASTRRGRSSAALRPMLPLCIKTSTLHCAPCRPRNVLQSLSTISTDIASRRLQRLPTHQTMLSSNNFHEDVTNLNRYWSYEQR